MRGDVISASTSIEDALADTSERLARARLLPAQVEIALAAGDMHSARSASAELDTVAGIYGSPALAAASACGRGALLLANGDAEGAAEALRDGTRQWREASAPYEESRARLLLAEALLRTGSANQAMIDSVARTRRSSRSARVSTPTGSLSSSPPWCRTETRLERRQHAARRGRPRSTDRRRLDGQQPRALTQILEHDRAPGSSTLRTRRA